MEGGLLAGVLRSEVVLERGIIVLLEKHVHLQNDVGALRHQYVVQAMTLVVQHSSNLQAAKERARKERNSSRCCHLSATMVERCEQSHAGCGSRRVSHAS